MKQLLQGKELDKEIERIVREFIRDEKSPTYLSDEALAKRLITKLEQADPEHFEQLMEAMAIQGLTEMIEEAQKEQAAGKKQG